MSRSRLAILGTVSVLTLMAASASQAVSPRATSLGTLRPAGEWKVGTVDTSAAAPYCAMVGKFDKNVVLAIARSQNGFGSIAIDFREKFFESGAEYEVTLRPDSGKVRNLVGRATSDRSVVVQVGNDEPLFQTLSSNGTLGVGLPALSGSFALRGFAPSYKQLVSCAEHLSGKSAEASSPPAVKVADVERDPLEKAIAGVEEGAKADKNGFAAMEAQLDKEAAEEAKLSGQKIAALDARMKELESRIAAQKAEEKPVEQPKTVSAAQIEWKAAPEGADDRKLLASTTGGIVAAPEPAPSRVVIGDAGAAAPGGANRPKTASLKLAVDSREEALDTLAAEKAEIAEKHVSAFNEKEEELKTKIAGAEKKRDTAAAKVETGDAGKADKAALVAAQAQVAELNRQRRAETELLTQKLSETQTQYESRIATLETERDDLRRRLSEALVAGEGAGKLTQELAQARADNATLSAERDSLRQQLASVHAAGRSASEISREMEGLQKEHGEKVAALQAERDDLKQQLAAARASVAAAPQLDRMHAEYQAQIAQAQAERDGLRRQLEEARTASGEVATLSQRLQQAEAAHKAQLAALQAERDGLKHELEATGTAGQDADALRAQMARMQEDHDARLSAVARERDGLRAQLATVNAPRDSGAEVEKILAASRKQELLLIQESQAKLQGVRAQLAASEQEKKGLLARIAELQARLTGKGQETSDAGRDEKVSRLEGNLQELRAERDAEAGRATQVQQDLLQARRQIEELKAARTVAALPKAEASAPSLVVSALPVPATQVAPVPENAPVASVTPPRRKPLASTKDLDSLTSPPFAALTAGKEEADTAALADIQPATGEDEGFYAAPPVDIVARDEILWDSAPREAAEAPLPEGDAVPESESVPMAFTTDNFPVPAVPAKPVEKSRVSSLSASSNRAAAFLDRIMSFHRGEAQDGAPVLEGVDEPVEEAAALPVLSVPEAPEAPQVDKVKQAEVLAAVAPAAGTSRAVPPVALETLLEQAGLGKPALETVTPVGNETLRQWSAGGLTGMIEQTAATGNFDKAVQGYLGRYREDCPGLETRTEPTLHTAAGDIAVASVACPVANNAYTTSFVFVQNEGTFSGILHTGYPQDEQRVRATADRISGIVASSGGLAPLVARSAAIAVPAPEAPQKPLAPETTTVTYGDSPFETMIVR